MKQEELIANHRALLLTRTELFAGLTEILSANPGELDSVRGLLNANRELGAAFDAWLDDLKFHPQILNGDRLIEPSEALLLRLGPPVLPADAHAFTATLRVPATVSIGEVIGAQARIEPPSGAPTEWSVAIKALARRFAGAESPDVIALLTFIAPDAPSELAVQQAEISLFRNGVEIGFAKPSRQVASKAAPRELDDEFLHDVEAA